MMTKRVIHILTAVILIVLLTTQAAAVGPIELDQGVSLEILCQNNGTPIVGADFSIYHIASVDASGELTPTQIVRDYNIDLSDPSESDWLMITSTLEGYLLRDDVPPTDYGTTDENGRLVFPNHADHLEPGLYLVMGARHEQDGYVYEMQSFLVMLPTLDEVNDVWIYDVLVRPKYIKEPIPGDDTEKIKVLKIWNDEGNEHERPDEIVIQLLCDGEVYDTVILNKENGWSYTWENLEPGHQWLVVEVTPDGYTVVVSKTGITYTVTNSWDGPPPPPTEPPPPDLPQTGQLNWPIPVLVLAGLFLILIGLLRRRGSEYEG